MDSNTIRREMSKHMNISTKKLLAMDKAELTVWFAHLKMLQSYLKTLETNE